MSTMPEADAVRPRYSSKGTQPGPQRADENTKLVQRKIDQNLRLGQPGVTAGDPADRMRLPGSPSLMAQLAQPRQFPKGEAPGGQARPSEPAEEPAESADVLARAWAERMAKQWEDVTARLLRDFAPAGGRDAEAVLAHIAEQRSALDSATVRDYLPVLVERAVRRLLDPDDAHAVRTG